MYNEEGLIVSPDSGTFSQKASFLNSASAIWDQSPAMSLYTTTSNPAATTGAFNPLSNVGPGGSLPPYTPGASSSTYNNTSLVQNGWYGGDHYTGVASDPGNYGHVDNTATLNQAISAAPSDATVVQPFDTTTKSDFSAATSQQSLPDVATGYQTMYNNVAFTLNNDNFQAPSTSINYAQLVSTSATDFGICVAGLAGAYLFGAEAAATEAMSTLIGTSVAIGGTLLAVANDCVHAIQAGAAAVDDMGPAIESIMVGAGNSIISIGRTVGDQSEVGFEGKGGITSRGSATTPSIFNASGPVTNGASMMQYVTPGFTPSAATLDALKPDMTAQALATYFPNG